MCCAVSINFHKIHTSMYGKHAQPLQMGAGRWIPTCCPLHGGRPRTAHTGWSSLIPNSKKSSIHPELGDWRILRMAKARLAEPISAFEFEMHWQIATDCGKIEQNYVCLDCDPLVPFVQLTLQDLPPTLTTFAVRLPTCETHRKLAQRDCTQNCLLPRSHASDVQQLTCKRLS